MGKKKTVSVKYTGGSGLVVSNPKWMPDLTVEPGKSYDLPEEVARDLRERGEFEINPAGKPPQEPKKSGGGGK